MYICMCVFCIYIYTQSLETSFSIPARNCMFLGGINKSPPKVLWIPKVISPPVDKSWGPQSSNANVDVSQTVMHCICEGFIGCCKAPEIGHIKKMCYIHLSSICRSFFSSYKAAIFSFFKGISQIEVFDDTQGSSCILPWKGNEGDDHHHHNNNKRWNEDNGSGHIIDDSFSKKN